MWQTLSQNKMTKKTVLAVGFVMLALTSFSCSPKAAGVRAQVKTGQTNLNPAISAVSQQQAQAQGVNYQIRSVSVPNEVAGGWTVDVELITPNNQFLPLKTQHVNGMLETQGTYTDQNGSRVDLQATCSANGCDKYVLLITVSRNNQKLFQTGAISYANDCKFNVVSLGSNVANLFTTTTQFEMTYSVGARGDATSDSCQN